MVIAVYPGSFDPWTNGHMLVLNWALEMIKADKFVVAIGTNSRKKGKQRFPVEKRLEMIRETLAGIPNVEVDHFDCTLVVDYLKYFGAKILIRGMRNSADYLYEEGYLDFNLKYLPELKTIFFIPPFGVRYISSSTVMEVTETYNWKRKVRHMVPQAVFKGLVEYEKEQVKSTEK